MSKRPVQERSQSRLAAALVAAERLLAEIGPEKTSIPEIAKLAEVPRASIYQYFPDKYALFAHLAEQQMERLAGVIAARQQQAKRRLPWRSLIRSLVDVAADHYNESRVASILLLDGPFSRSDQKAHFTKDTALGEIIRAHVSASGELPGLPRVPDVATLAVEIAFACMKYGYLHEGTISGPMCEEASRAAIAYLERWD